MTFTQKISGLFFTTLAIVFNFWFMGWPVVVFNAGLLVSLIFWWNYKGGYSNKLSKIFLAGLVLLALHGIEEYFTGLYEAFPKLLTEKPWTAGRFVAFLVFWYVVFVAGAYGTFKKQPLAFLVAWFFVLFGCLANGILHIFLSLWRWAYFPGTVTAVLLLIPGIKMLRILIKSEV